MNTEQSGQLGRAILIIILIAMAAIGAIIYAIFLVIHTLVEPPVRPVPPPQGLATDAGRTPKIRPAEGAR